jgi:hypothetical protein
MGVKRKRPTWKSQTSLFRTIPEAVVILKAADQLHGVRAETYKYKITASADGKDNAMFGVRVRKTTLVKGVPESDANELRDEINAAFDRSASTMVHRSREIHEKIILNLGGKGDEPRETKHVSSTVGKSGDG